jgi:hypothetical protein
MDPSPHATFRPREKETKHFRRTRKNDREAFNKLEVRDGDADDGCDDVNEDHCFVDYGSMPPPARTPQQLTCPLLSFQTLNPLLSRLSSMT